MKRKNKIIILGLAVILIAGFGINKTAEAADPTVYISPTSLNKKVGDTFNISVKINPSGQKVCMVESKLILNKLSCQKISISDGLMASPNNKLTCGDLYFSLGIPGCTTNTKTLFTVEVKAKNAGTGTAKLTGVDIIGEGVSLSSTTGDGSYTITSVPSCDCGTWGSWQNGACEAGSCSSAQRLQTRTRTCVPSGCGVGVESRCIDDSSCGVQKVQEGSVSPEGEGTPSGETPFGETSPEGEGAQMPPSGHKSLVINPEETMLQKGLLATAMVGISESAFATILIILCLGGLVIVGAREWTLVQERKKK